MIIDTVRASLIGSEDGSESVSAYLRAVRRLLAPYPEAAGLLAHHAGWQDGEHGREAGARLLGLPGQRGRHALPGGDGGELGSWASPP